MKKWISHSPLVSVSFLKRHLWLLFHCTSRGWAQVYAPHWWVWNMPCTSSKSLKSNNLHNLSETLCLFSLKKKFLSKQLSAKCKHEMKYHCVTLKTLETHWNSCINDGNVNAVVEIREILRHLPKDCCLVSFSHPVLIGSRTLREQRGYPQLKPELVPTQCCHPVLIGSWALGVQSGYPQQTPQWYQCSAVTQCSLVTGHSEATPCWSRNWYQCSAVTQCSLVAGHSVNKEATLSWNWYSAVRSPSAHW